MKSQTHLVLIPSYNSGKLVYETVIAARRFWNPVWVVFDGSTDGSDASVRDLAAADPGVVVLALPTNQGKGAAIAYGARQALAAGFSHILSMDADGQHPASEIPTFMAVSQGAPNALILGKPVFAADAPALRVAGRQISNWWANLETGWRGIADSLFGFRVYPIAPLLQAFDSTVWMRRFDFDPEAAVRLIWLGLQPINLPAPVRYVPRQQGGISHFHYLRDNALLTFMHTRLVLGRLWRLGKTPGVR